MTYLATEENNMLKELSHTKVQVKVSLRKDQYRDIKAIARSCDLSLSQVVRMLVESGLNDFEETMPDDLLEFIESNAN